MKVTASSVMRYRRTRNTRHAVLSRADSISNWPIGRENRGPSNPSANLTGVAGCSVSPNALS